MALLLVLVGCGRTAVLDSRVTQSEDAGAPDAGLPADAGQVDAGLVDDAGLGDAGLLDAGGSFDAGCSALSCVEQGVECGAAFDGCGGSIQCGTCVQRTGMCAGTGSCVDGRCEYASGSATFTASSWQLLDEEFPSRAVSTRIHIRDDAKACGGYGANRSLVRWDLTSLAGHTVAGPATVSFTYTWGWSQYLNGPSRSAEIHEVTAAWIPATSWATAPPWNPTPWSSAMMPTSMNSEARFLIPGSAVQRWVDDAATNDGVLIKFTDEDCPNPRWPCELGSTCDSSQPNNITCAMTDPPRLTVPCN